jgi:hypothetical protein
MAATSGDITLVSIYTVSDSAGSKFTTAVFNYLASAAADILDAENPGLTSVQYNIAHAYLICHLFEMNKTSKGGMTSEKVGEWSISRNVEGGTTYYQSYKDILSKCKNLAGEAAFVDAEEGVTRIDAEDQGKFMMDNSETVDYND